MAAGNTYVALATNTLGSATATVTLFDLTGKVVATQTVATSAVTNVEMNTTALQAGSYIYTVVAGEKVATGKLIKQ